MQLLKCIIIQCSQLATQLPNGSDHVVIACYLGVYEEGEVEHINDVVCSSQPSCLEGGVECSNRHTRQETLVPACNDYVLPLLLDSTARP